MDNIERLNRMKELSKLKAELHKRNALSYLQWTGNDKEDDTVRKVIQYGEIGYSVFQFIRNATSSKQNETKGTTS